MASPLRSSLARLRPSRVLSALRWRAAMAAYRRGAFRLRPQLGAPAPGDLVIVVCLWNRAERIDDVLRMLDAQHTGRRIHLVLWNNDRPHARFYRQRIRVFRPAGALGAVSMWTSPVNVGGLGRFFAARALRDGGYRGSFLMLDDDEDITPAFAEDLLAAGGPRTVAAWWAWTMDGSYWNRRAAEAGDRVDYAGTGGCVCDIDIVASDDFFTGLPRRFAFLEDLWMCGYARAHGWTIRKAETQISFVLDETNQHHGNADLKREFYDYLRLGQASGGV